MVELSTSVLTFHCNRIDTNLVLDSICDEMYSIFPLKIQLQLFNPKISNVRTIVDSLTSFK